MKKSKKKQITRMKKSLFICLLFVISNNIYAQYAYDGSSQHVFTTNHGTIEIGPFNTSWAHIYTDRPKIIFNKDVYTTTNAFSSYDNDLVLKTKSTERFRINDDSGNVGIGKTNPSQKLDVNGGIQSHSFVLEDPVLGSNSDFTALYREDVGSDNAIVKLRIGDDALGGFNVGYKYWSTGEWVSTFFVNNYGKVGIGTTSPDSKLTVKGNIHAEEVKVDLSVPGPDYVFKEGYDLMSLGETQKFIKKHGHLPNIPSAKEMEENGLELGIMNMKLLEKIEELMLYVIDLKAENLEFKKEIEQLKTIFIKKNR
ncbi:tail fiber protein [Sediminicola sp. YIK13]|uniref:tail fiber protein n=1 Tax=Sediminicola sp. YIK13 TaxID=1453352 RepID=UPI000781BD48|nr:tail fiber protein [Sediminicola sp. YIK13]